MAYVLSYANSISLRHNWLNSMPTLLAALGKRLVAVNPGIVLTSKTNGKFSLFKIISTREQPKHPRSLCANKAVDFILLAVLCSNSAGTI